jgi:caffeoyl-CoA O-methyltransferase
VPATERHPFLEPAILDYIAARAAPPDDVLLALHDETVAALGDRSRMQVSPDEGALLSLLTRLVGARNAVEIGTFTGYSSICMARALPPDGNVITVDVNAETTEIAHRHATEAGVADRIDYRVVDASETARTLSELEGPFELVFIDADKAGYVDYYEAALPMLADDGLLVADNVLWSGRVVGEAEDDSTRAIQRFNEHVRKDDRVETVMLTVRDGMTLVRKR